MKAPGNSIDIDSFWEYLDPAASEGQFRSLLGSGQGDERLELLTQIARTYGLRQRFAEAHQVLNEVEAELAEAGPRPQIRYLLERGRTHNSSGEGEMGRAFFVEAWERAQSAHLEGLAADAAHMVAITYSGRQEALDWNRRGLELARGSEDPKALALIPAMLNNSGWDLHDMGRFAEALPIFEEALAVWRARGKPKQVLVAKWAVARCLRSLGRHTDALAILRELETEHAATDSVDGTVFEEIGENLVALGELSDAQSFFGRALDELSKDDWFVKNEASRLAGIRARAG